MTHQYFRTLGSALRAWTRRRGRSRTFGANRHERTAVLALAALTSLVVGMSGAGLGVERDLLTWRDGIRSKPASGKLAVVEIDAKSLAALPTWPWPRHLYGEAIAALQKTGASLIVFDIDFSASSSPQEDQAFARAIEGSSIPVVLPTFVQARSQADDGLQENLPRPELRRHALLASVNIWPDPDGLVRSYPYGIETAGTPRPSVGAILAGTTGRAGQAFPIDGAIVPSSVPKISFVDLIHGRIAPGGLKGKAVLIGGTAIELGDQFSVPGRGVLPGPLIQALAAETLIQGSSPFDRGPMLAALSVLLILALVWQLDNRVRAAILTCFALVLFALPLAAETLDAGTLDVVPALASLLAAAALMMVFAALAALRQARLFDPMTGLPNRRKLGEDLQRQGSHGALVIVRMRNFGDVLGLLGQKQAAELTRRVAERLALAAGETLYRLDDDSLAWTLPVISRDQQIERVDAAAAILRAPVELGGRFIDLTFAFGIAEYQDGDADAIGRALMAAERAVASGARWERHSDQLAEESDRRLSLAAELDRAMAAGDLWVAYQPKLDLGLGRITAAEALVRWRHPERGAIPPDAFIPMLEENGRMADLTLYVLETVLADMAYWGERGVFIDVAVNVSALLPSDPMFMSGLEEALRRSSIEPGRLTLEVTESATLSDPDAAIPALNKLAELGVRLSIDDYGAGQSTLSYLKRLPAKEIKIDMSFVLGLESSRSDQLMVRSTIDLAHELGFKVVAEGVETLGILELLRSYGCDTGQGWHIGRPVPGEEFLAQVSGPRLSARVGAARTAQERFGLVGPEISPPQRAVRGPLRQ